ncbi:MAG: DNA helicase [Rhodospirillales bacterium]|nr:DNA helicase [Rhodospirillales bacterium]
MSGFAPRVRAVLGPTNTGKTHLALTRLLAHASGIIGFPLRLLARENYDRMVALRGAAQVALMTGEEKIVPPGARWFACTAEAMPLDRAVEFVAVDEIQLCADPDRGHVFTDRLLNARGLVETMFLGAETIRPLLTRLVPGIEIETRPRLSQLTHAGPTKLSRLPPRSAIVAFSAGEVYAIAEAVRRRRGGCALVMGRLSPRTRNAQVALYQQKEVDFLVATDAIGMGLNMDVEHVAFAGLQKFDGHRPRRLHPAEIGQIAGRAGRGMRDGTFGTTATCPPLTDAVAAAVENHSFEPLEQLCWRNAELDTGSVAGLLASLAAPPQRQGLVRGNEASDAQTLAALAADADILALADRPARVRLLWEACQIPDFRKLSDDTHALFCARVFRHLSHEGRLPTAWITSQLALLDRSDGDIDTLMQRLAGVRIWAYVAARPGWLADAPRFQGEARDLEDRLSDALHERLMSRFVDRRAAHLLRRLDDGTEEDLLSAVTANGLVIVEGHPVGRVEGFDFLPDATTQGAERRLVQRAARRALHSEMPRRVSRLEAAGDDKFALLPGLRIAWDGVVIARLRPGPRAMRPLVAVRGSEFLDGAERERIRRRLQSWMDDVIRRTLRPLAELEAQVHASELRGVVHRLGEGLGVMHPLQPRLPPTERQALAAAGVRVGRFATYMPALLKPGPALLRARLLALAAGREEPTLPAPGLIASPRGTWDEETALALGWLPVGPMLLRLDIAERVAGELTRAAGGGPSLLPADLASRLGMPRDQLPSVLRALGFQLLPGAVLPEGMAGPAAPPRFAAVRRRRTIRPSPRPETPPAADGPFAALAALRRPAPGPR